MWARCHQCYLCKACYGPLARPVPFMPPRARANDMWGGPLPDAIRVLSYAETKVLQLARACVPMKRVGKPSALQNNYLRRTIHWVLGGRNVVAYPQRPEKLVSACLILTPEDTSPLQPRANTIPIGAQPRAFVSSA